MSVVATKLIENGERKIKVKMIKTAAALLAAAMAVCALAACGESEDRTVSVPVHVEGSIFGAEESAALTLKFNPDWIVKGKNDAYSRDLAQFSALLSTDVYFRQKDLAAGKQNRVLIDGTDPEEYTQTMLLTELGFSDVQYIESFRTEEYDSDTDDSVTMTIGHFCPDGENEIFAVAVRGCFSAGEWSSTYDPGCEGGDYETMTGEHPDWKDGKALKGTDVAARRAIGIIREYIEEYGDFSRKSSILITGHSRGGAIAEIVGADFEDDPLFKSFTYTFSAAPVTADSSALGYSTIFNVFDSADFFVNYLPFGTETYYRYGRSMSLDISASDKIRDSVSELLGGDGYISLDKNAADMYRQLFGLRFSARDNLYRKNVMRIRNSSRELAGQNLEDCLKIIGQEGLGISDLCSASASSDGPDDSGMYETAISYCDAAQLRCIGLSLAYGAPAADAAKKLFSQDKVFAAILDLLMKNSAEISGGHRLGSAYVLAGYLE